MERCIKYEQKHNEDTSFRYPRLVFFLYFWSFSLFWSIFSMSWIAISIFLLIIENDDSHLFFFVPFPSLKNNFHIITLIYRKLNSFSIKQNFLFHILSGSEPSVLLQLYFEWVNKKKIIISALRESSARPVKWLNYHK